MKGTAANCFNSTSSELLVAALNRESLDCSLESVMKLVHIWRRDDAIRLPVSAYVTVQGGLGIGRGLGITSEVMPGERLGQYMGHVGSRAVYNATDSGYGHLLDENTVLDCTFFSRHYCLSSHCNDYRGVVSRQTGEAGEANCEIVRGDPDEIWLVATCRISPGPRGYAELLTFYGEKYEVDIVSI
ncbi:hypothetical protein B484DRAFT_462448 [Ochromonadaceae sp. CCMP2298]|nr:hypothetical protein B484DRAFT_462448 [Ochromonadaceae sp. CCMP2298]